MSVPVRNPRRAANDVRPVVRPAARAIPTITLAYRPKKPARHIAHILFGALLAVIIAATCWYGSWELIRYVEAHAMPSGFAGPTVVVETHMLPQAQVQVARASVPAAQTYVEVPASVAPMTDEYKPVDISLPGDGGFSEPADAATAPMPDNDPAVAVVAEKLMGVPAVDGGATVAAKPPNPTIAISEDQLLDEAHVLLETGDDRAALAVYEQILLQNENSHAALSGKIAALMQGEDYQAAVATSHQLLRLYPDDSTAQLNLMVALGQSASPQALNELKKMARANPTSAPVHAALAKQYIRQGDLTQALYQLDNAAREAPNDILYRVDLAILYDRSGKDSEALALYQQVLHAYAGDENQPPLPISIKDIEQRVDYLQAMSADAR